VLCDSGGLPEMALASAAHLEEEVKLLRKIQDEVQKTINTRAQLVAQLKENELVKQELDLLDDESRIFKLIGPILVKQEKKEADSNVSKRIDFLQGELRKLETNLDDLQKKQMTKRRAIIELQAKMGK